jgi:NitT/TauT family transport system substrate-binding protein
VQVDRGFGSGETAKSVGLEKYDFGEASFSVMVNSVGHGLDLMAVGARLQRNPFAIFSLKGRGIQQPKDLEGKTVIASSGSGDYVLFPAFAKLAGFDASKVKFLLVAPTVRHPMLLERKADAMTGYLVSDGGVLLGQGIQLDIIPFAAHGFRLLDAGLLTQSKRVREDPRLCADFIEGAMKGLRMQFLQPRESIALTLEQLKEYQGAAAAQSIIEHGLEISNAHSIVPAVEKQGLGAMDPEDWTTTVDLVARYMGLEKRVEPSAVYTNRFAGTEKLTAQEWATVKARVRKIFPI